MILKPSLINHRGMQFLITHAPDDDSLPIYVKVGRLPRPTHALTRSGTAGVQCDHAGADVRADL